MKKIIISLCAFLCAFGISLAQDIESVTELYNKAALAVNDNKEEAITLFEQVLEQATALGEQGAEMVEQSKGILPKLYLAVGKAAAGNGDFNAALEKISKAAQLAEEFGDAESKADAEEIIPKVYVQQGADLVKAGDLDGAVAAFEKALQLGQTEIAGKQLSNIYVKKAAACQKAKDLKGAVEAAQKSVEYLDNPNAQKIIGLCSLSLKQNKVAADALEAYLAMKPDAKDKVQIIYQLGTALVATGENGKACGYFKQIAQDAKWGEAARYQLTTLKCN